MLENSIAEINARLKAAATPVRVRLNGRYLVLRAMLPNKPGEGTGRKQRDLSLNIPANKSGLKRAETEAHKLGEVLARGTFAWDTYLKPSEKPLEKPIAQLVQEFKDGYMHSHRIAETTWIKTWQQTFNQLPQSDSLKEGYILAVVMKTKNHTRSRELVCQRLQKLANFAGLKIDLKPYEGEYGEHTTEPRDISSDAQILEWRDQIPNPAWQWVYGMMASFGLRDHECFFYEFRDSLTVEVLKGKTGGRTVRAIPSDWVARWKLMEVHRPNVTGKTFQEYGDRVCKQFSRYEMPLRPYDLRHAYAIRGSVVKGLPVSTMAGMMGHGALVHTKTYHRWITDATNESVYRRLVLGEN